MNTTMIDMIERAVGYKVTLNLRSGTYVTMQVLDLDRNNGLVFGSSRAMYVEDDEDIEYDTSCVVDASQIIGITSASRHASPIFSRSKNQPFESQVQCGVYSESFHTDPCGIAAATTDKLVSKTAQFEPTELMKTVNYDHPENPNVGTLFVENGSLRWKGSSGTITTLAAA